MLFFTIDFFILLYLIIFLILDSRIMKLKEITNSFCTDCNAWYTRKDTLEHTKQCNGVQSIMLKFNPSKINAESILIINAVLYILGLSNNWHPFLNKYDCYCNEAIMHHLYLIYDIIWKFKNNIPVQLHVFSVFEPKIEYILKYCINLEMCELTPIPVFTGNDYTNIFGIRDWSFVMSDYDLKELYP